MAKNPFADDRPDVETIRKAATIGAAERETGERGGLREEFAAGGFWEFTHCRFDLV